MALKEIEYARESDAYDHIIVNDDLDKAYETFKRIALGEDVVSDKLPELVD